MVRCSLLLVAVGALTAFVLPIADDMTQPTAAECGHTAEVLVLEANAVDASSATTSTEVAVALTCGECCPTYNPDIDCWAEGHWHYEHCKESVGCDE